MRPRNVNTLQVKDKLVYPARPYSSIKREKVLAEVISMHSLWSGTPYAAIRELGKHLSRTYALLHT